MELFNEQNFIHCRILLRLISLSFLTCSLPITAQTVTNPLDKIGFSLVAIDANGLIGTETGKRSQAYEFCIPKSQKNTVQALDPSVQFSLSPGRVQCQTGTLLAIGETHQPQWRAILVNLARLPYVEKIAPHWAE
ncbi:MAG: hypothetical protein ACK58N_04945 [Synechocystis sp.]|jgi:hypothetical protein